MATHDYTYPRPWEWSDNQEGREGQLFVHDTNGQIVAWIGDMEVTGGADLDNAALIAAAPDLREAVQALFDYLDGLDYKVCRAFDMATPEWNEKCRAAREALAKANEFATTEQDENVDTSF